MVHPRPGLSDDGPQQDTQASIQLKEYIFISLFNLNYRFFDENSWKLDCVHKAETVTELASLVNEQVLSQVFDVYCEPMTGGEADEYSLNKARVSR